MKNIFNVLIEGCKYWILQGLIEILVILIICYSGNSFLFDFSLANLFIENVQFVVWIITYKTIMFFLFYLILFYFITLFTKQRLRSSYINLLLSLIWFVAMSKDKSQSSIPFLSTSLTSSILIIVAPYLFAKIKQHILHKSS